MSRSADLTQALISKLTEKDKSRLDGHLNMLIEKNHSLGGQPHGFLFQGQFFTNLPKKARPSAVKKLAQPQIHAEAKAFCEEITLVENETKRMTQGLHLLLRDCVSDQDVRDALPDTAKLVLPNEIAMLPRFREPAWPFKDKPLHMHNYHLIEELLNFYAANQILY